MKMSEIRRQELFCHSCGRYVQFDLDLSLNGNHVLNCPVCDHEHCRTVKDGEITDIRWDQRNGVVPTIQVNNLNVTSSSTSTYDNYINNSTVTPEVSKFSYESWMNTTTSTP